MDTRAYIESGMIESYVLGLASHEEVAEVEQFRFQYGEVNEAIESFSQSLESEALNSKETPPAFLKDRILNALKEEQKTTVTPIVTTLVFPSQNESNTKTVSIGFWKTLAAASVILFLASSGFSFYFYNRYAEKSEAYQALLQERDTLFASNKVYQASQKEWDNTTHMMTDSNMMVVKMKTVPGKKNSDATVFWDIKTKDVYLMANVIPHPESGKQYQLWALVDGKPVDAGTIDPNCAGTCKMKNIPRAQAFAITLEKEGGSPTPDLTQLYVMGNI